MALLLMLLCLRLCLQARRKLAGTDREGQLLRDLASGHPLLEELCLGRVPFALDADLAAVVLACPFFFFFFFFGPRMPANSLTGFRKGSAFIRAVAEQHGTDLKSINLLGCYQITDRDLAVLVAACPRLEQLELTTGRARITQISDSRTGGWNALPDFGI